jgi:hypothetical protein
MSYGGDFTGSFNTATVGSAVQRRKNIELDRGTELTNLLPASDRQTARVVGTIVVAVVLVALTVLWFLTW